MHQALKREFDNLKTLANKKGKTIALMESNLENVIFISSGKKLVCLVVREEEIHNILTCFKVNLKKWEWAEAEGFSISDGLPKALQSEILIKLPTPSEYLGYLDL